MNEAKKNPFEAAMDLLLARLAAGVVPWRQPWTVNGRRPYNPTTGREYTGFLNVMLLSVTAMVYGSNAFLGFGQARKAGGSVRKGEKATWILRPILVDDPASLIPGRKRCVGWKSVPVFNLRQCDGLEKLEPPVVETEDVNARRIEAAESLWTKVQANICPVHYGNSRAYYVPSHDVIHVPDFGAFTVPAEAYSVYFHEAVHATGHKKRCDRKGITDGAMFGSHTYSEEELVAEIGAAFLCSEAGIVAQTADTSAAYIANWHKRLSNDPEVFKRAIQGATAGAKWAMGTHHEQAEVAA